MKTTSSLLSGRLLAGNVIWSMAASGLPLLVGLWAIPVLIDGLGKERFGLLAIIWMGIGYFSLFDLGIGRALTKLTAEALGAGDLARIPSLVSIGMRLMTGFGVIAALIFATITPGLVDQVLKIPATLTQEAKWSFWILASTLPFVVSTAGLIGVLQAHQRFRDIALVRIPLGLANFLGPVLALLFSDSLVGTTIALAAARIAAWLAYHRMERRIGAEMPSIPATARPAMAMRLLSFGGWITVSNIVGPIMVYFDRFFIGSILGLMAVTYYTTPYEIIARLQIISIAVADVVFPAMATALEADVTRAREIYGASRAVQMLIVLPLIAMLMLFARAGLGLWLGPEFAERSTAVLQWLALGVYINAFARLPLALLQGKGRPDITAKIHSIELPIYAFLLWRLTFELGILGTAMAWTGRIILDTLLQLVFAAWKIPELRAEQFKGLGWVSVSSVALVGTWFVDKAEGPLRLALMAPVAFVLLLMAGDVLKRAKLQYALAGRISYQEETNGQT